MVEAESLRRFAPVGRCIYCGATNTSLTQEHIVPYGLGGNLVLPKSSCRACADITKRFEQTCLRAMLGPLRIRLDMPTRRQRERPERLQVTVMRGHNRREILSVSAQDHPIGMVLGRYGLPRALGGNGPTLSGPGEMSLWYSYSAEEFAAFQKKYRVPGLKLGTFDTRAFVRLLAKIAHSFAVADLGPDSFEYRLPKIVLGDMDDTPQWIGGDLEIPPAIPALHRLEVGYATGQNAKRFAVVNIRLFASFGAPQYRIVVGEC